MKQDEHERKTYILPREACFRLDTMKQLIEAQEQNQAKGSCAMSDEMVKKRIKEHEQQQVYSHNS